MLPNTACQDQLVIRWGHCAPRSGWLKPCHLGSIRIADLHERLGFGAGSSRGCAEEGAT